MNSADSFIKREYFKKPMFGQSKKEVFTFFVMFVVIASSFMLLHNHKIKVINAEYTGQLTAMQSEMRERYDKFDYQIKRLADEVEEKTLKIQQQAESDNKRVASDLSSKLDILKKDNTKKLNLITGQLNRVQVEKDEALEQVNRQLKQVSADQGDFSKAIEDSMKSTVSVETLTGRASGTIVSDDGYIVTSKHVVADAKAVVVGLYKKGQKHVERKTARIVKSNDVYDLAVLKISLDKPLRALPFGDSRKVKLGEKVFALGNPGAIGFTATEGIVSATNRYVGTVPYVQTDSPINIGNSGGPLINRRGELVGINTLKVTGYDGISLALPSYIVQSVSNGIIRNDRGH